MIARHLAVYATAMIKRRPARIAPVALLVALLVAGAIAITAALGGFFDRDPTHFLGAEGGKTDLAALYFSGDMGLRFGMGPVTTRVLARHGIPVLGISSSTAFATRRDRAYVDRFVADGVRAVLAKTGAKSVLLIGQSYGADILQTGLAHLPPDLRKRVAAIILVVPGRTVFFRADPLGIAYHGTPDSLGAATVRAIDWAPLTCIYGTAETDSLCPALRMPNATLVAMPGGHFLGRDDAGLVGHVLGAIHKILHGKKD